MIEIVNNTDRKIFISFPKKQKYTVVENGKENKVNSFVIRGKGRVLCEEAVSSTPLVASLNKKGRLSILNKSAAVVRESVKVEEDSGAGSKKKSKGGR